MRATPPRRIMRSMRDSLVSEDYQAPTAVASGVTTRPAPPRQTEVSLSASGPVGGGYRHAYLADGSHWRTRLFGIAGTSSVCLAMILGALISWAMPSETMVHQSSAPLSVIQISGTSDQSSLTPAAAAPSKPLLSQAMPSQPEHVSDRSDPPAPTALPTYNPLAALANASGAVPASRSSSAPAAPPSSATNHAVSETPSPSRAAPPSGQAFSSWEADLLRHLERFRRYPSAARVRGQEGVTYVAFTMNRAGQVLSAKILRSSKVQILDRAALDTLQRAQPLPKIPADMPDVIDITVPVEFFTAR